MVPSATFTVGCAQTMPSFSKLVGFAKHSTKSKF